MGAWFPGERVVFRGKDLHRDLRDMTWMELYLYGITAKEYSKNQLKVLNALWTFTSFPDPRLWNNRIAAIAGTARSTPTLALSSAMAASEATIFGHGPSVQAIDFFLTTKNRLDGGEDLEKLVKECLQKQRTVSGFGRPLFRLDERIPHLLDLLKETSMDNGTYVQLALDVEKILKIGRWRMNINIAGLGAAIAADLGFSAREFHFFKIPCFLAGMPPLFLETSEKKEGTFFPFRCERIQYNGIGRRKWNVEKKEKIN